MTTESKTESEHTVFLTNSKEHLLVIFQAKYNQDDIKYATHKQLDYKEAKSMADGANIIVSPTEGNSIDLTKYPPVLIKCSSQSVLDILQYYIPEKKFFLVYSWYDIDDSKYASDEYEDYLYALLDLADDDDDDVEIEVVKQLHRVYVTEINSGEEPGREIFNFPGSSTMKIAAKVGCGPNFEYDDLSVFDEEMFNNWEVKNIEGKVEIEGKYFPIAPELIFYKWER
tara:strand:- start:147 stop:827 length:681 start_codon:yes stop_codon:yes gene_type:complete